MVDTTCGSVLNVWKNVKRYAGDGFTSIIHGKHWHEETRATASQALHAGGHYLVVLNRDEADEVCRYIRRGWRGAAVPRALRRRGVAGLRSRPPPRARRLRQPDDDAEHRVAGDRRAVPPGDDRPPRRRASLAQRFRAFDTICSATQDRQDAVQALLAERHARRDDRASAATTAATPTTWPGCARRGCRRTTSPMPRRCSRRRRFGTNPSTAAAKITTRGWLPADGRSPRRPDVGRLDAGQRGRGGDPAARGAGQRRRAAGARRPRLIRSTDSADRDNSRRETRSAAASALVNDPTRTALPARW